MRKKVTISWNYNYNGVSVNGLPFNESMEVLHACLKLPKKLVSDDMRFVCINGESADNKNLILENVENLFLNNGYIVAVKY